MAEPVFKICSRCHVRKPTTAFSRHKQYDKYGDGRDPRCKSCRGRYGQEYYRKNRVKTQTRQLLRRRRITRAEYDRRFTEQGGVCAICRLPAQRSGQPRLLDVDHSHETGRIRGLLCNPCNRAIGLFKNDTRLLQRTIEYLEDNSDE